MIAFRGAYRRRSFAWGLPYRPDPLFRGLQSGAGCRRPHRHGQGQPTPPHRWSVVSAPRRPPVNALGRSRARRSYIATDSRTATSACSSSISPAALTPAKLHSPRARSGSYAAGLPAASRRQASTASTVAARASSRRPRPRHRPQPNVILSDRRPVCSRVMPEPTAAMLSALAANSPAMRTPMVIRAGPVSQRVAPFSRAVGQGPGYRPTLENRPGMRIDADLRTRVRGG